MTDENNISKLGDKLGDSNVRQTRRSLKFTDYAIDRYNADFINAKGKTQKQVRISFDVSKKFDMSVMEQIKCASSING